MNHLKFVLSVSLLGAGGAASACDLCNAYSALAARGDVDRGFHAAVAEQYSHFRTLQQDGMKVPNPEGEKFDSWITQGVLGYNFTDRFGVQLNVPVIYRSYRREGEMGIETGHESGFGDASLLGHVEVVQYQTKNTTFNWFVLGGVKFPTGDSARLAEEAGGHAHEKEEEEEGEEHHHASGIHGHDLALGSGSVDGLLGTGVFARWQRLFFSGNVQWAIRSEGDFDYRFANDVIWAGGPGVFLALGEEFTVGLQAMCSGETKGEDTIGGMKSDDSAITTVYLGPQLSVTWRDRLSLEIGGDLPVHQWNSGLQILPDYRVRGALSFRF